MSLKMYLPFRLQAAAALGAAALAAGLFGSAAPAGAAVLGASAEAYGLDVDLNVDAGLVNVGVGIGPLPSGVNASSGSPFQDDASVVLADVDLDASALIASSVTAEAVNAAIESNVDGLPGSRTVSATGGVLNLDLDVGLLPTNILGTTLTVVGIDGTLVSEASITGDYGSLSASGSSTITDLGLTLNGTVVDLAGLGLDATVLANPAPNTTVALNVAGLAGATLILNEQIVAPDQSSITVNAFRLSLGVLGEVDGNSVIGGDIVIGHSEVAVSAVPEPASVTAGLAAGLLVLTRRRRSAL